MNSCKRAWPGMSLLLVIAPVLAAADRPVGDSEEINKLLADAKGEAVQLKQDAELMDSYSRATLSWESHAAAVTQMKEHINAAGKLLGKLNEQRAAASAWQQDAIDRITPLLKELAANTDATIEHLNANRPRLHSQEYQDYLASNYEMSSELAALIGDFVEYGKTKAGFERLKDRLEVEPQ